MKHFIVDLLLGLLITIPISILIAWLASLNLNWGEILIYGVSIVGVIFATGVAATVVSIIGSAVHSLINEEAHPELIGREEK